MSTILAREPERHLAGWRVLPLLESVRWNQAPLLLEWSAEAGFVGQSFRPRVDEPVADGFVFRPRRN
jgi:hypothetical protein